MAKSMAIETIKKIQEMRSRGATFKRVASELDISPSTAHIHGRNHSPEQKRHTFNVCGRSYHELRCGRSTGHGGVHLADGAKGLIYWE